MIITHRILAFDMFKGQLLAYSSVFPASPQRQALGWDCVYHLGKCEVCVWKAEVARWGATVKCSLL